MKKLELKHLAPYLPYGLKLLVERKASFNNQPNSIKIEDWEISDLNAPFNKRYQVISCKPILKSLNDLEIEDLDFSAYTLFDDFRAEIKEQICNYETFIYLIERHYDVFGLIDSGLAIDINTL